MVSYRKTMCTHVHYFVDFYCKSFQIVTYNFKSLLILMA